MQVYSGLNLYDNDIDLYFNYLNSIKSIFKLDCNILEIGGGMLPILSNKIAIEQLNIGKGTITMYDHMRNQPKEMIAWYSQASCFFSPTSR